jgi:hypothetical protein
MLTPQALERCTPGYRRGYRDGYADNLDCPYPDGSWAAGDWSEGFEAGRNDRRWDERREKRNADRVDGYDRDDLGCSPDF